MSVSKLLTFPPSGDLPQGDNLKLIRASSPPQETGLFVFGRKQEDKPMRMRRSSFVTPKQEEISQEGNQLACILAPQSSVTLAQWKAGRRRRKNRQSRSERERLAELSKYVPLANCRDGL